MAEKDPQFSAEEVKALVDEYFKNKDVLQGNFKNPAGAQLKRQAWDAVQVAVNAAGHNSRSLDKIKKKLKNMKQITKATAVANSKSIRRTGGGSDEEDSLDSNQEKLLATISKRQITGIEGGFDVHERKEIKFTPKEEELKCIKIC